VELAGASLSEDEFEAFVQEGVKVGRRADKANRRKALREINPQCEMKILKSARYRSHEQQKNPKPSSFSVNC
jgi:hypothetical protein